MENKLTENNSNSSSMNSRYVGKLIDAKLLPKDENGFTCCRWCNGPVKPPKKTMCCPECVHEILIRTNTNYLRTCVYKRDKAICALCKIDTTLQLLNCRARFPDSILLMSKKSVSSLVILST